MPVKRVTRTVTVHRRRAAAALRLKGLYLEEIVEKLHARGFDNPVTGKRWTAAVISLDLKLMREKWQESATESTREMLAAILAEIRQHRRSAWAKGDLFEVRLSLAQEIDLLGLAAPKKLEVSDTSLLAVIMNAARELPDDIQDGELEEPPLLGSEVGP